MEMLQNGGLATSTKIGHRRKGMSGIIGISPNMKTGRLGQAPIGHIIKSYTMQIRFVSNTHIVNMGTTFIPIVWAAATGTAGGTMQISGITATQGNILHISANGGEPRATSDNTYESILGFKVDSEIHAQYEVYQSTTYAMWNGHVAMTYDVPASFTNKTIALCCRKEGGGAAHFMQVRAAREDVTLWMLVQEIQQ